MHKCQVADSNPVEKTVDTPTFLDWTRRRYPQERGQRTIITTAS